MKKHIALAPVAALGLLLGTTALHAQATDTRSVSAAVQGALTSNTGFLTGGQVQVTGVGQGSVVLERSTAAFGLNSGATAGIGAGGVPVSSSSMVSTFDFDRGVTTSGALVGIGNVVAQGESLGGIGIVGSANSNATRAGTGTRTTGTAPDTVTLQTSGSSTTPTTAQGSMVGDFSTRNNMQLSGTGSLFAGAQTLDIGERNAGISAGLTGAVAGNITELNLNGLALSTGTAATSTAAGTRPGVTSTTGGGAGFAAVSELNGATGNTIDMNASNAGNGSVLVSGSTGGFFGEGTAWSATAAPTFSDVNGFFGTP